MTPTTNTGGVTQYTSYIHCYSDKTLDPHCRDYQALYQEFAAPTDGYDSANKAALLRNMIIKQSELEPQAYLMLTQGLTDVLPNISVVHQAYTYQPRNGAASQLTTIAFLGDVHGQVPPTAIHFPTNAFIRVPNVRFPTNDVLDQMLAEDPTTKIVGPFAEDKAGTKAVAT